MLGYFITGTDTGVGKTFVTALLANLLQRQGRKVAVYKPIETGGKFERQQYISNDMEFVKNLAKLPQPMAEMNTYCLREAVSPSLAAELENKTINLDLILTHFNKLQANYDWVLVEGAGGICVPISGTEILISDLIKLLNLPVIVVARPNLGTINHTVLTVKYAQSMGLVVKGIIINYTQRKVETVVEKTNPRYIAGITGVPVLGIIPYMDADERAGKFSAPEQYLNHEKILRCQND